ncbi:hypothetical protein BD413DRAFT_94422 [Trametes elegans]|nr:hypothetical protein BD413DRAFT_94422 [Trametes elegans]
MWSASEQRWLSVRHLKPDTRRHPLGRTHSACVHRHYQLVANPQSLCFATTRQPKKPCRTVPHILASFVSAHLSRGASAGWFRQPEHIHNSSYLPAYARLHRSVDLELRWTSTPVDLVEPILAHAAAPSMAWRALRQATDLPGHGPVRTVLSAASLFAYRRSHRCSLYNPSP